MVINKFALINGTILFLCICFLLPSCASWKTDQVSRSTNMRLSQKIVAEKLAHRTNGGTGAIIIVDSLLAERSTIFNKNEFLEAGKLFPDLFYPEKRRDVFPLVIPDSLTSRVKYISKKSDIENGPETFFFFSPLLPTRKKNVFVIQIYHIFTIAERDISLRLVRRYYERYEMKDGNLQYIDRLFAPEDEFSLPF